MNAIKPLGWTEPKHHEPLATVGHDGGGIRTVARTIVGRYEINSFDGDKTFVLFPAQGGMSMHRSLQEAREAAQSDFERIILSAFVPSGELS